MLKLVTWLLSLIKYVFGLAFIAGGIFHFVNPKLYLSIMPPYLPWHSSLVYLSGFAEVLLGLLLLFPATQTLAAWGLIALLVAVFPANLHMALNTNAFASINPLILWLRLPLQGVLIAIAYLFTRV